MSRAELKEYRSRTQGGESAETLLHNAESDPRAESDRILMEGPAEASPPSFARLAELKEAEVRLTPRQQKDKEFCVLLGMSEADATRVATSNCIRD
jgi:hypothetical protein